MFGDNFDPSEEGDDLPKKLIHTLDNLDEILEAMEAREGKKYASFVVALFSITNVHSTQAILLAHCASDEMLEIAIPLEEALKSQMYSIMFFVSLLLAEKKTVDWINLTKAEQKDKVKRMALQIAADVTMLLKQQTGENHAPI